MSLMTWPNGLGRGRDIAGLNALDAGLGVDAAAGERKPRIFGAFGEF
jgi:hypothetical protein